MKRTRLSALCGALPLALAPLALAGCIVPVGGAVVGDLRVTWSFEGSQRCAGVGVENVVIQLIEKGREGQDGAKAFGQTAECIAGSMVIENVLAGTYVMTAVGTGEVAVFDNEDGDTIEVVANTLTEVSAPLLLQNGAVVAGVAFGYTFAGEPLCSAAGITNINAQVVNDSGEAIAGSNTDCVVGLAVVEGIVLGEHTLKVEAVDGEGNVRFFAEKGLVNLQAGETKRIDVLELQAALVDVTVNFNFGDDSCSEVGVDNVAVQILDDVQVVAAQNVPCIDGRATFPGMPVGDYTVNIDGIDGNGEVLFRSEGEALLLDGVDEQEPEGAVEIRLDDITVELEALLATVTVPFVFPPENPNDPNSNPATCATLGVQNVDIQIIDSLGNTTGITVPCVAGDSGPLVVAEGLATIRIDALVGDDVPFSIEKKRVDIERGETVLEAIELETRQTTLAVSWDFLLRTDIVRDTVGGLPDGAAVAPRVKNETSCVAADVDTVIVRVFRGDILEIAQAVDCDDGRLEMPGIALRAGATNSNVVTVELEGIREQEGDAPFATTQDVTLSLARTEVPFTLEPALAFALIVWRADCGAVNAATVDVRITAGGIQTGINLPCAQGSQKLAFPANAEKGPIDISIRGVDGLGSAVGHPAEPINLASNELVLGISTIIFNGPAAVPAP